LHCGPASNGVNDFVRAGLVGAVTESDVGAVLREAFGDGAADALIASGDGDGLTFETVRHVAS
jgi:hypothetical protein